MAGLCDYRESSMSEISRMAAAFEEKSKQQAEDTEQAVKRAFEKHESALLSALNESEKKTSAAIRAQHQSLRQTALRSWMYIFITIALVILLGGSTIMTMGWYIERQVTEIANNRVNLEMLQERGSKMNLITCGDDRRLCVEIDPDAPAYSSENENKTYRILKGY
jgi:Flp pilus assembly protein TadB